MPKFKTICSLSLVVGLIFCGTQAFAAKAENNDEITKKNIEKLSKYEMPHDVKDVLLAVPPQGELSENGEITITPYATSALPGHSTSDTTYSNTFGSNGQNTIYAHVDDNGYWNSLAFYRFSGWGYTGYFGTGYPSAGNVKSTATVKAYGLIPNVSINGSNWSLLSSAKQIGNDSNLSGYKYARANYSNVKIQNVTGVNAIFTNKSYIKLPSGLNDSWSEDTYVWF